MGFMKYSGAELRNLAAQATPLHERFRGGVEPHGNESPSVARLQKWRDILSVEGAPDILVRRLALDGLDVQDCLPFLGVVGLVDSEPLPAWAKRLNALLLCCPSTGEVLLSSPLQTNADARQAAPDLPSDEDVWAQSIAASAETSLPFWDVWVPFVKSATEELRGRAGSIVNNLSNEALQTLQSQLLANLAHVAALPLSLEFRRFLAKHDPLSIFEQPTDASVPPRDLYSAFVRHLHRGGLLGFFQEYASLARLMAELAGHWIEHVHEFCHRLDEDRPALTKLFTRDSDLGPVVEVTTGISDPHHRRRDVLIVTFSSGLKIVYKPKDLGVDEAFRNLIDWLNTAGLPPGAPRLRVPGILNRTTHGWVEFVEHRTCYNPSEIERYYTRIGMLLCLAYVLGASDVHQDNIIASGEQPILLDLETMMQPPPRLWGGLNAGSADQRAVEIMHDSVLRTGLLPFWIAGYKGRSYDVSGIGSADSADTGYLRAHWENVNNDRMRVVYRTSRTESQANRPMLHGDPISPREYVQQIRNGFTEVYRVLLARRDVLLTEDGPLSWFRGLKLRCLLRMSKAYWQVLNRRMHPEFLRDGAEGGIEFERLARDFVFSDPDSDDGPPWGIYCAEVDALERLDLPFFAFYSDSHALFADGRVVAPGFFPQSGLQSVISRVRTLSEEDLRVQTDFIVTSMYARYEGSRSHVPQRSASDGSAADGEKLPLTNAEFVAAAVTIAEQISHSAIRGSDGGITWLSMAFDPTVNRMNFVPMSDSLYDGRVGVAFFLAALEHVTRGTGFRDLVLGALMPLRKVLRRPPPLAGRMNLGGAAGLGGQLYALVRIAEWLSDDELRHLAVCATGWFIRRRIALDVELDVFGGSAGGILGLLTLWAAGGNAKALGAAVQCGEHLLERRIRAETGHLVWPGSCVSRPLTGFGHGAAGIAYALLRLSQASAEPRFRQAAAEGIAYETAVYSSDARNWPDFRGPAGQESDGFMVAWCNGAAGIGLGRLGGLPVLDTPSIRGDIANALETTRFTPLTEEDHVCCGNMGRLDLLAEAGRRLGRLELLDEARRCASTLVRRAARNRRYGLFAQVPGVTDSLSLFHGIAGIGYELLRLAEPDGMPCMLLWD
jgi:type 2 lantibiotic biosynthesis protein LanM